ncbi:MAG TPA: hypothetical protein PKD09_14730 [Aggregatilinea sp.]|uniref:hypothetical protein n=1 Tax=Aggregatilinea sp. TaxID=2806333 RepID=UPI002B5B2824|nr:hypothetical protein [Aggregatilinea sp.]HML22904.1 hypothetical protein [Aggregatilinea sp.]
MTLKRTVLLAAVLGLFGAIFAAVALRPSASSSIIGGFGFFLFTWGLFLSLATPLMTTVAATHMTARLLHSEDFELVYVTTLSNHQLVGGQVVAVLHRMRAYLIVQASLLPLLAVGSYWMLVSFNTTVATAGTAPPRPTVPAASTTPAYDVLLSLLLVVAALVMLWNMNLLAVTTGVRVVLMRDSPLLSGTSAVMWILGLTVFFCAVPVLLLQSGEPFEGYTPLQSAAIVIASVVLAPIPVLMALLDARRTARRWVR